MNRNRIFAVVLFLAILLVNSAQNVNSDESSEISVEVMIDFGNGIADWTKVVLNENRTAIKATEEACSDLNLSITVSWSQWGAYVSEIGGLSPPDFSWWWGFFIWNPSLNAWEAPSVGASGIELEDKDIIGWSPVWDFLNPVKPIPTPFSKYPWPRFQKDALNSGATKNLGPITNSVSWIFDTQTIEMVASPAISEKKVVVNNWGGTFCLNYQGQLLWKNENVKGGSSPTIGHQKVLVGANDGYLYALNTTSGESLWSTEITSYPGLSGVSSSPTLVMNKIYLGSFNFSGGPGYFYCLNEDNGVVLWKTNISSSVYFSSASISEEKVYVGTMGLYNSTKLHWEAPYGIYCFDSKNGNELWYFPANGSVGSSPTIVDGSVLFTSKDSNIYCLNAKDGDLVWKKNLGSSVSSPSVWEDRIYVGTGEMNGAGKLLCLDTDGNFIWEYEPNGAVQSSPALTEDCVYFSTNVHNGTIYCLNRISGKLVWKYKPYPEQYIISSPAIAQDKLFIGCDNGRLYCLGGASPNITADEVGLSQLVYVGEDVLFYHKDEEKKFVITKIEGNTVTLEIDSTQQILEVGVGETRGVDTDGNGKDDLSITINTADSSSQIVTLTLETPKESQDGNLNPIYILLCIIIIIIIIITITLKKRK